MALDEYSMRMPVWLYPGMAGWHFVNVTKAASKEIKDNFGMGAAGFGSIPVMVTVGKTSWKTSIFPDKRNGTYLLPIKAEVRKKEGIVAGKLLAYSIKLRL